MPKLTNEFLVKKLKDVARSAKREEATIVFPYDEDVDVPDKGRIGQLKAILTRPKDFEFGPMTRARPKLMFDRLNMIVKIDVSNDEDTRS
jgi:hypothetical protein